MSLTAPTRVPGEEGLWVLVFGDLTVFAFMFAVYLSARGHAPQLFAASQSTADRDLGALNTLILLSSSLLVVGALRAARQGDVQRAPRLVVGAMLCGAGFSAVKVVEYTQVLGAGLRPDTNGWYTYYFVLTGLHLFHVVLGLGALTFVLVQVRRPDLTPACMSYVEGATCFWHLVDVLWILLFPLLYLVR